MNYNKTFILSKVVSATTAGTEMAFTFPNAFLVRKIWVVTHVAGVEGTHTLAFENYAGTENYANVAIGTTVAGTLINTTGTIEAGHSDKGQFDGGTVLKLKSVVNESTGKYTVFVAGAHAE
jgi:hypothetical protein